MRGAASFLRVLVIIMPGVVVEGLAQTFTVPVQQTISTPYGNVNYTTHQVVGRMGPYGTAGPISRKYEFTVVLKNDSSFAVKTRIDIGGKKHFLLVKSKKRKWEVTPDQTKEISRLSYLGNSRMEGIPSDSCWLFLSVQGKISAYSFLAELNSDYLVAIQKYSGPLVKLTDESLREMLEDHEKALKYLEKKRYREAIEAFNSSR